MSESDSSGTSPTLSAVKAQSDDFEFDPAPETTPKNTPQVDDSDEFDLEFSAPQKKVKKLKASSQQRKIDHTSKANNQSKNEADSNIDNVQASIQADALSKYLAPTNILSQYQDIEPEQDTSADVERAREEDEFTKATENLQEQAKLEEEVKNDLGAKLRSTPITVDEMVEYLTTISTSHQDDITVYDKRTLRWLSWFRWAICGPPALSDEESKLRDLIFCFAKTEAGNYDLDEDRLFQTLWMKITVTTRTCPRTGAHWEVLGFQGNDPATDTRGSGLLGPLQLLWMVEKYPLIAQNIYKLSRDERQEFPFAVVSFNMTGIMLNILRQAEVYSLVSKKERTTILDVAHKMYAALFLEFYLKWKNGAKTILDFSDVKEEVKESGRNWKVLLKKFESYNILPENKIEKPLDFGS